MLIQSLIAGKHGLDDGSMLPDRDHRQLFDIEVDCHGDQIAITLGLHDLFGCHRLLLGKMDLDALVFQDQFGGERPPL